MQLFVSDIQQSNNIEGELGIGAGSGGGNMDNFYNKQDIDLLFKEKGFKTDWGTTKREFEYSSSGFNFVNKLGGTCCVDNNFNLFIQGGNFPNEHSFLHKYDVNSAKIIKLADLPQSPDGEKKSIFFYNNKLHLISANQNYYEYNIATDTWINVENTITTSKEKIEALVVVGDILYYTLENRDFYSYDLLAKSRKKLGYLQLNIANYMCFEHNGLIHFMTGNLNGSSSLETVEAVYDIAKDTWEGRPNPILANSLSYIKKGNLLYFCGGSIKDNIQGDFLVYQYNLDTKELNIIGSEKQNGRNPAFQSCTIDNDNNFISIGGMYTKDKIIKLNIQDGTHVSINKASTETLNKYKGIDGEIVVNTTNNSLHLMDGIKAGGTVVGTPNDLGTIESGYNVISNAPIIKGTYQSDACYDGIDNMYIIGSEREPFRFNKYNITKNIWEELSNLPYHNASSVNLEFINNKIYSVPRQDSNIYEYDITKNIWTILENVLNNVTVSYNATSCAYNEFIFIAEPNGILKIDTINKIATKLTNKYVDESNVSYYFDIQPFIGAYNDKLFVSNGNGILIININTMEYIDRIQNNGLSSSMRKHSACSQFIDKNKVILLHDENDRNYWKEFNMDTMNWEVNNIVPPEYTADGERFVIRNNKIYMFTDIDRAGVIVAYDEKTIAEVAQAKLNTDKLNTYKGINGQLVVNTDTKELHLMDGETLGGKVVGISKTEYDALVARIVALENK